MCANIKFVLDKYAYIKNSIGAFVYVHYMLLPVNSEQKSRYFYIMKQADAHRASPS